MILGGGNVSRGHLYVGRTFTRNRLGRKKLLIVFDDVSGYQQLEFLIGYFDYLNSRSRIIITSRDMQVLRNCSVEQIYQVNELFHDEALKLFSRYAFKQNHPPVEYMELSNKIVSHTGRVPLALTVLGSMLREREKPEWETVLSKITRIIDRQTYDVLKLSYDKLDDIERYMFLDIACFFVGEDKDLVETFMHATCIYAYGLHVLVDKSLLTVSKLKNKIEMHNLIRAMGREIVRTESVENPARRSRLWHHEDIYGVLKRNTGTDEVLGISLDMSKIRNIQLDPGAFSKMHNLRFLKFYNSANEMNSKVHLFQGTTLPSRELSYFYWHAYPLKSLPSDFNPRKLCALHLPYSNLEQLPNEHFFKLKYINLSHSKLTKIPDIPVAPSLESLILEGCNNLLEIPSSVGYLDKLVTLNLRDCKSLKSLPNYIHLKSLKILILSGCSNLSKFPEMLDNIKELYLGGTIIEELPSSIEYLSCLIILDLENCSRLTCLPNGICKLKCLEELNLTGCSQLGRLPDDLGSLKALKKLKV
ncbi:hypothetical protein Dsin_018765 [Dipteronia sinensis]|uniref:Uncharacterized protein n=1 Tax=Dipteronia sinensis TaxID=43782 RepID=A0AAE0E3E2_9ROSI|nr:hypothetical protein Dsin_018765 [Dipteronia sinensis]